MMFGVASIQPAEFVIMPIEQPDDPYKSFKFRIRWSGRHVAGVETMSAIKRATQPIAGGQRFGRDPKAGRISGAPKFEPITLERGVTHDAEFAKWANAAHSQEHVSLKNTRRDVTIDVFDDAGQRVQSYNVRAAWVSEFVARSGIVGQPNAIAIESITLQHEGWERD